MFWAHSVSSYNKPFNTLRSWLLRPTDKNHLEKQCRLSYKVECVVCHKQYNEETERILGKRFEEHTDGNTDGNQPSSVVQEHNDLTDHLQPCRDIVQKGQQDQEEGKGSYRDLQ